MLIITKAVIDQYIGGLNLKRDPIRCNSQNSFCMFPKTIFYLFLQKSIDQNYIKSPSSLIFFTRNLI